MSKVEGVGEETIRLFVKTAVEVVFTVSHIIPCRNLYIRVVTNNDALQLLRFLCLVLIDALTATRAMFSSDSYSYFRISRLLVSL